MQIVAGMLFETIERLGAIAAPRVVACRGNFSRAYRSCLVLLQQLPFANSSLNSSSNSEPESITEEQNITSMWTEFDNIAQNYCLNFKLGHVNANGIGGFKFL